MAQGLSESMDPMNPINLSRLSCLPRETDLVHFTGVAKAYGVKWDLPRGMKKNIL
jgi:hypothetical protein